jgi:hypothetical protein
VVLVEEIRELLEEGERRGVVFVELVVVDLLGQQRVVVLNS